VKPAQVAIIGSGNIGTDLLFKIRRLSTILEVAAFVGIDPMSDGLVRADRLGVPAISEGIDGLLSMSRFSEISIVFDATSAQAHHANAAALSPYDVQMIDLTPAALGPYVVPAVNLEEHVGASTVNMVTCGGQATIPVVAAVRRVTPVHYAEIVASIASRSAGPGTRANIDEFTETTSAAIEIVGGAAKGKAIIVLNPAEPPMIMRDTVHCLVGPLDDEAKAAVTTSIEQMVAQVAQYVPGYRLKQLVQYSELEPGRQLETLAQGLEQGEHCQVSVFLEVEGAAHYLPAYAGNLDIMTSAAVRVGEEIALRAAAERAGSAA
jgi:acetaldehyde dehydrogenase